MDQSTEEAAYLYLQKVEDLATMIWWEEAWLPNQVEA